MTPTEIKAALSVLGGGANKHLGQHFLIDRVALETMVNAANIRIGDRVLEVGPGLGVLTLALLEQGAQVRAIEQDRRMVEYLSRFATQHASMLQIMQGDAATIHWHTLIGEGTWKFVSNLPYAITSLALRKALWAPHPPEVVAVLVQREVAERVVSIAGSSMKGKTSLLSLMVALSCSSARILRRVPPGAFFPPPKVDSAILQLIPMPWEERRVRWGVDPEEVMRLARLGFAHPRKLLTSNLGNKYRFNSLTSLGLSEKIRAEDVSPDAWARLAQLQTP